MNIMSYILCFVLIVLGVLSRVIDHAPNFTPVIAIAIMSGSFIKNKYITDDSSEYNAIIRFIHRFISISFSFLGLFTNNNFCLLFGILI